jgi:hypothetical protein
MSSKFHYIANGEKVVDPIAARNLDPNTYYSLGNGFDNYAFRRIDADPDKADEILEQRMRQLRDKYKYIRVWFSGGKDSTLILATAIKHNIHIDEIVIVRRFCKKNLGLYTHYRQTREIDGSAIAYLESIKDKIPKTKISFVDQDDKEFAVPFKDPKWYTYTNEYFFGICYTPNMFYRYLNPKFKILTEPKSRVDLCGAGAPAVWREQSTNQWHFSFSDTNFVTVHSSPSGDSQYEDFLFTEDMPQLAEYYVNTVVDSYIADGIETEEWRWDNSPQLQRAVRDRTPLYNEVKNYKGFQFPKTVIEIPFKETFWHWFPMHSKSYYDLVNRYLQTPRPKCLRRYIENTDWVSIKHHRDTGRILTKIWKL